MLVVKPTFFIFVGVCCWAHHSIPTSELTSMNIAVISDVTIFLANLCIIVENHTYLIDWLHYTQCQNAAAKHNKTWIVWIIRRESWRTSGQISWWKILVSEVVMFLYRLSFISFHQPVHHLPNRYIIVHVDSTKINYRPRAAKYNKYVQRSGDEKSFIW